MEGFHDILSAALHAVMSLPDESMPQAPLKKEENYEEYLEAEKLIKLTFNSLQLFTAELLVTTLTPEALQNIVDVRQRLNACRACLCTC